MSNIFIAAFVYCTCIPKYDFQAGVQKHMHGAVDMNMEFSNDKDHTNTDMLSRTNCGICTQCLMEHEEAKKEKPKTRRLNAVVETTEHK